MKPQIIAIALVGFFCILPITWRQCVKTVLFLVVVEGAVRKWILPNASEFVYFIKDFVLVAAYVKYYFAELNVERDFPVPPLIKFLILASSAIILLQMSNYNLGSPILGMLGVRNYLLYIPLIFLVRDLFDSIEDLNHSLRWYLLLPIPIAYLAVNQYFSGADAWINRYAWGNEELGKANVGSGVRVTGTFSYIAGFAAYLQTCAGLIVPLLVIEQPPVWKWLLRVSWIGIMASILMTGSRGPIIALGILIVGYFIFNRLFRELRLYRKFILPVLLCVVAGGLFFQVQVKNITIRFSDNSDLSSRVMETMSNPTRFIEVAGFFGFGAGSTYQAADIVRSILGLPAGTPINMYFEGEPERVILELGPVGFLVWYLLRLAIMVELLKVFLRLRYPLLRELALTAFLVHALSMPGQMVFQITYTVLYWFLAGFILALPKIEYLENQRWEQEELNEDGEQIDAETESLLGDTIDYDPSTDPV